MKYYFSKRFNEYDLAKVDYEKCDKCGFVASRTHYELSDQKWNKLNNNFHKNHNKRTDNPFNRNQRYFNQALMLFLLKKYDFFPKGEYLDWGSGEGDLSKYANNLFNFEIKNYDKYIKPDLNIIKSNSLKKRNYALVINTGVFEHIRNKETLHEIESYVKNNGCLAIHTLVTEVVPKDEEWMYLLPVHCSFHTNKSMSILIEKWGYKCSTYNEDAKSWILFKEKNDKIEKKVQVLNKAMGWEYLKYKKGFLDFWK